VAPSTAARSNNIIADEVKLQITLRTFTRRFRKLLLSGIERVAKTRRLARARRSRR